MKFKSIIFWSVLVVSILAHLWLSTVRHPLPTSMGFEIHAPSNWQSDNKQIIRVSTYNIRKAKGTDDVKDIHRTASVLGQDEIIGLQEVQGASLINPINQAEQLGEILDIGWLYTPIQIRYYQEHNGNALLSQFPVHYWHSELLPWTDQLGDAERSRALRKLITAKIRINGKEVTLFVAHIDRGSIRDTQIKFVLDKMQSVEHAILMGDLNEDKDNEVIATFLENSTAIDAIRHAMAESDPETRIDWIMTKGFKIHHGGMEPSGISDHPYYWVELSLVD